METILIISGIPIKIINNTGLNLDSDFCIPGAFNIWINYYIKNKKIEDASCSVILNLTTKNESVELKNNKLLLNLHKNTYLHDDFNSQFSVFGNKGIVQKFILHEFEKQFHRVVLHACAVRNPKTKRILIGIGGSGHGKSAFVSAAILSGWEIITTEQAIIDKNLNIYKGNIFDNASPDAVSFFQQNKLDIEVFTNDKLVEPIGQKVMTGIEKYCVQQTQFSLLSEEFLIINLNFSEDKDSSICEIDDDDFILRIMQTNASEKIMMPNIIGKKLFDFLHFGDAITRQRVIDKIIMQASKKMTVCGDINLFKDILRSY